MVLAATFRIKNDTFAERLRTAVGNNEITQAILKEMSQGDVKEFTKKDKF